MAVSKSRTIYELDVRNVLPLVASPTLVVHARDNAYVRVDHGRYLAEHIDGARLVELDGPEHWPLPDSGLLGAVEEFVTGSRLVVDDAERVLATVLVVDVVGSTERASELSDRRWSTPRARFEDVVRQGSARTAARLSMSPATAPSPRSTGLPVRSAARGTSGHAAPRRSRSAAAPAARSRAAMAGSPDCRSHLRPSRGARRSLARCWLRRSVTSSPVPASRSTNGASTSSRACPTLGAHAAVG